MSGLCLDAGAVIALERGDRRIIALLDRAHVAGRSVTLPAGVLAQAWRADRRQHRLQLLLRGSRVVVVSLDRDTSLAVGALCARSRTSDVVDASVAVCARARRQSVVTSDPDDLRRLDPGLDLITV